MSGGRKSTQEERAIAALLSEPTIAAAAKVARISEATLWRWLQRPDFQASYRTARRHLVEGAIGRLQLATTKAVDALERNLTARRKESVQVRAAAVILDHATKAVELMDLEARVAALEERAAQREGKVG